MQASIRISIDGGTVLLSPVPRKDGYFLIVHEQGQGQGRIECDRDGVSRFFEKIARTRVWMRMFRQALEESDLPGLQKDLFLEIIASFTSSPPLALQSKKRTRK